MSRGERVFFADVGVWGVDSGVAVVELALKVAHERLTSFTTLVWPYSPSAL
jgi:hypothetical protein